MLRWVNCTPVMTPDVLCGTDVGGAVTVFFACCLGIKPVALFAMLICEPSLLVSSTRIVASTWRGWPCERCRSNGVFWSLDATLNVYYFVSNERLDFARFSLLCRLQKLFLSVKVCAKSQVLLKFVRKDVESLFRYKVKVNDWKFH